MEDLTTSATNSNWTEQNSAPQLLENTSLPHLFFACADKAQKEEFCRFRNDPDTPWSTLSWEDASSKTKMLASFLKDKLNGNDSFAAVISASRMEWIISDYAIQSTGLASVSIYQTLTEDQVGQLLDDCGARIVFVENQSQYNKVKNRKDLLIISFEKVDGDCIHFDSALEQGNTSDFLLPEITQESLASIVYTSGTTGVPKGVVQTHGNHLAMLTSILHSELVEDAKRVFLYLPLAHSFARLIAYTPLIGPGSLVFPTIVNKEESEFRAEQVFEDIKSSGCFYFPSVPRLFEKVMTKTQTILSLPIVRGNNPVGRWIRNKLKEKIFGSEIKFGISGGAPLGTEVGAFFEKLGLKIYEGYGLTETTPAMCANTKRHHRPGSVGRRFNCNEIKIAPSDSEILVRGENVFSEYLNKPDATKKVFTDDGWFMTGDIGHIDSDGYLFITDRKKDLIVSAGGKNIAPALTESKIKVSKFVSQAVIYGDRKPYLVALITLESEQVNKWLKEPIQSYSESEKLHNLINEEIERYCVDLASYEQVKRFCILDNDLTIEAGELTPSLKVKRKVVVEKYKHLFEELYEQ